MAARSILDGGLTTVLALYRKWAALLPEPSDAALAQAAAQVNTGKAKALAAAVSALGKLAKSTDATLRSTAQLWLGRALARAKKVAEARKALSACAGQAATLGQCEFELALLVADTDADQARKLCERGYALLAKGQ